MNTAMHPMYPQKLQRAPKVIRVAYWAGKETSPGSGVYEPHQRDHVDWRFADGSIKSGYRFEFEEE